MNSRKVYFENKSGEKLSARLQFPSGDNPDIIAIFAHCFTCSKDLMAVVNISRALNQHNIGVLRFDFTGLGESEGEFSDTNFTSNVTDLEAAASYLKQHYQAPSLLIGHSLGGAAVLVASQKIEGVKAVVTIAAPADPEHVTKLIDKDLETIENEGKAKVNIGGRDFAITRQFLDDLRERSPKKILAGFKIPLLILHSPQDRIVGIENARMIYEAAHHPKSFISLDGADHLLSRKEDSNYAGTIISSWAKRYIEFEEQPSAPESERQVVTSTGDDGYTTEIMAGKHHYLADEPLSVGGKDLGATPYDFLVSALGACTGMTLRMYADRKQWPLEEVRVHLSHDKIHEADCETCEKGDGRIDELSRDIELTGNLTDQQKERLLEIADKCPVHRTLTGDIRIKTSLTD